MSTDPADVLQANEQLEPQTLHREADRLGIDLATASEDELATLTLSWRLTAKATTIIKVCQSVGVHATELQARNIAKCILLSTSESPGVPLSDRERELAHELYYQALKSLLAKDGKSLADAELRQEAARMVHFGERGLTPLHKVGRASGCAGLLFAIILIAVVIVGAT